MFLIPMSSFSSVSITEICQSTSVGGSFNELKNFELKRIEGLETLEKSRYRITLIINGVSCLLYNYHFTTVSLTVCNSLLMYHR